MLPNELDSTRALKWWFQPKIQAKSTSQWLQCTMQKNILLDWTNDRKALWAASQRASCFQNCQKQVNFESILLIRIFYYKNSYFLSLHYSWTKNDSFSFQFGQTQRNSKQNEATTSKIKIMSLTFQRIQINHASLISAMSDENHPFSLHSIYLVIKTQYKL